MEDGGMVDSGQLLGFTVASLVLIVVPGPGVLFVVGRALAHGRRTAFMTAAGDAIAPVSPTPFTPIGFVGLGVSVRWSSQRGNSAADGTR